MPEDPRNPWQTIGSRQVYVNPWIRVREDHVIRADGQPGIYGVVEFQNHALGIVPVSEAGDTWLVGQWRYPLSACTPGKSPKAAARWPVSPLDSAQAGTEGGSGPHRRPLDRPGTFPPFQLRHR